MEVEEVTHAIQWLASQRHAQSEHVIIIADSMHLLQEMGLAWTAPDWYTATQSSAAKTSVDILP